MSTARRQHAAGAAPARAEDAPFDLLRVPVGGGFLRWRHARTAMQVPALVVAAAMIAHGLFGPSLAPTSTWTFRKLRMSGRRSASSLWLTSFAATNAQRMTR